MVRPFIGPAGKILQRALDEAGISRKEVYITNAVKRFKFEQCGKLRLHSKPSNSEMATCRHWPDAEVSLVKPEIIVCLGSSAVRSICGKEVAITKAAGKVIDSRYGIPALVNFHPSYILRIRGEKDKDRVFSVLVKGLKQALLIPRRSGISTN